VTLSRRIVPILIVTAFFATAAFGDEGFFDAAGISTLSGTHLKQSYRVLSETVRFVTAYNVGDPGQNSGDPCISANGEDICSALELGASRCAANFVPFGTELFIQAYGICVVTDRTNSRYRNRVDIAMKPNERQKAIKFGKKKLYVKILKRFGTHFSDD